MKKIRRDCLAIMTVMITLIVVGWMGMARAEGEEDMFTATTQPDALIILDLSTSMNATPGGEDRWASSSSCTADTTACYSPINSNYPYANSSCNTPDTTNCTSARGAYPFANNSNCTANTSKCTDTHGNCSGGFCKKSQSNCTYRCGPGCSGGFCDTPITGACGVDCRGTCNNGFCNTKKTGCETDCYKLAIAKRAIFNILDDNNDSKINALDKTSLGVRMGYMRWYNCVTDSEERAGSTTSPNYSTGCNKLIHGIDNPSSGLVTSYQAIYCGNTTSTGECFINTGYCSDATSPACSDPTTSTWVSGEGAKNYTPIAAAMVEAKLYLDAHKSVDAGKNCRSKFVILITDGADTMACTALSATTTTARRRESIAKVKDLAAAGYKVFVIGFGADMALADKYTLNWMAYYGNTDDPNTPNSGNTTAYNIPTGSLYPTGISSCDASTVDPGSAAAALNGYAFIATNADELNNSLKTAITIIRQANYSFSQSSIQASRTTDENYLYEGSFDPGSSSEPFWKGHLKKYQIQSDGNVGAVLWDAGDELQAKTSATRTINTYKSGALTSFTTANITPTDVGTTTASDADIALETDLNNQRDAVVGYIRGDAAYNPDVFTAGLLPWKLGDVFRSSPITIGTPSMFYTDIRDCRSEFSDHRANNERTSANGKRLIVLGANDGQLHAFKTHATFNSSTYTYTKSSDDGAEAWSFIPPNMLTKLKNITHATNPGNKPHQYFVDGPASVADIWDGTSATSCGSSCSFEGQCKADNSWKTILVFGAGRGSVGYAWSTSPSCDSGISGNYSVTSGSPATTTYYPYYCGYHALNVTDTSAAPTYMWHLNFTSDTLRDIQAPYLGDPWSKMMIGRILITQSGQETEKWVGFIGAGYNGSDCTTGTCDTRGKGFFVVDLANGNIIWSFTRGSSDTSTTKTSATMNYSMPASPSIADTDGDGFIDTAYSGDLGGNIWRFKFCQALDTNCGISSWSGGKFFDATVGTGNTRPIYSTPSVTKDSSGNLWVYWGTGNKMAPTAKTGIQEYFYGVKDDRSSTISATNVTNVAVSATTEYVNSSTNTAKGYRIQLANPNIGEKVLADSTIFGSVVYFTTYTPSSGSDACNQSGDAKLYGINFETGGGAISSGTRSMNIGSGIPSAPVISMKPGSSNPAPDLYVTTSGTGGGTTGNETVTDASTQRVNFNPPGSASRTNMLFWRDRRIQ